LSLSAPPNNSFNASGISMDVIHKVEDFSQTLPAALIRALGIQFQVADH
jgi:hypothetical protein